jgi:hypothetical protein
MRIPYLAHIPFVLVFLLFAACFVLAHGFERRR